MPIEVRAGTKVRKSRRHVKITNDPGDRPGRILDAVARRAYEIFENRGRVRGHDLDDWIQAESELIYPLCLEIEERRDALTVKGDLPGLDRDEFEVSVQPQAVTVTGECKQSGSDNGQGEAGESQNGKWILRIVELPALVMVEKATASFAGGQLKVILPKAATSPDLARKPPQTDMGSAVAAKSGI